uniref:RRM domain-containing protein n=1 Tax=Leersia perrieri TaxID=77586 RepID=A0A0D9VEJ7_9ORYZ
MATSISDLPAEVLRVIAGRHLHAALDAVRFHAVCTSWRHTLHHLPRRRPLLPWLLAPPSSSSAAGGPCRCVFSKTTYHAGAAHARDRRLAHADGTASWFVDGFFLNPLTGFPSPDHDHEDEAYGWKLISDRYSRFVFSRNGTFLAYTLSPSPSPPSLVLTGQTWVPAGFESYVSVTLGGGGAGTERFVAVALHGGATVCVDLVNCYVSVHVDGLDRATSVPLPDVPTGMARRRSYLVELGGEVLLASVLQDDDGGDDRLSVSVHALEHDHDGEAPPMPVWEKRDGGVLADHVFFLGFPGSFAVEAARFGGELPGGSAYFVVRSEPCRVYRCGIDDVGGGTAAPATVLLCDIAGRLHTAVDAVRFRAVCRAWRDTPRRLPLLLLPWLLAPSTATLAPNEGTTAAGGPCRCVFSKTTYHAADHARDKRVAHADGTASWFIDGHFVNPLTGATTTTAADKYHWEWIDAEEFSHCIVSIDGTFLVYRLSKDKWAKGRLAMYGHKFPPGEPDGNWLSQTLGRYPTDRRNTVVAYHRGATVSADSNCYFIQKELSWDEHYATFHYLPGGDDEEPGKFRLRSHLVEFNGELLLASVLLDMDYYDDDLLSVSVHALDVDRALRLHETDDSPKPAPNLLLQKRDGGVLFRDHVLFLGFPGSFAVEAARFGGDVAGGSVYFVVKSRPCRVYRYSFESGGMAAVVDTLPFGWNDERCMWFLPEPEIAPLLCLIAGRLHAAVDVVRFHAVCRSWHDMIHDLPPPCQRGLLPWLLAPSRTYDSDDDDTDTDAGVSCRCVFSKTSYQSPGLCVQDKRVAHADGTASWFINGLMVNPLTAMYITNSGRYPSRWMEREGLSHRVVSTDGAFLAYGHETGSSYLHIKGQFWTQCKRVAECVDITVDTVYTFDRCAVASYRGSFIVCVDPANCDIVKKDVDFLHHYPKCTPLPDDDQPAKVRRHSFLVELRGELLLASVLQDVDCDGGGDGDGESLSVSVHALDVDAAVDAVWERRDGQVLGDHVLFLGFPSSFAVEADRFGDELQGGTAYFVMSSEPCGGRVYRCSIDGVGTATVVDTLPDGWNNHRCMWFMPQPDIAEKYDDDYRKEVIANLYKTKRRPRNLRIHAGGLSPMVDSAQLRQMYSKYGRVLQARVERDKRGRSRGFGFVTMATLDGYDRALDRRPRMGRSFADASTREIPLPDVPHSKVRRRSFLVELRGELLLASVLQDAGCEDDDGLSVLGHALDVDATVYALDPDAEATTAAVWERRDCGGHVLFLGFPSSFAVEAARFGGELPCGTAYFVVNSEPCRVYRSGIEESDGGGSTSTTVVDTLPAGWNDERCMWFLPQPNIADKYDDDEETATLYRIHRRPRNLRMYIGRLLPMVDSAQLREKYSTYGKVLRAKIERD